MVRGSLAFDSGIHSTVPQSVNPQGGLTFEYDEQREKVLVYLIARKGQVRTAFKIAEACGYSTKGSSAQLRKAIKEINHLFGLRGVRAAIVSTPQGFYYTDNASDVALSIQRHRARIHGLTRTIRDEMSILERLGGSILNVEVEICNE